MVEEEGVEPEPHLGCAEQLIKQLSLTLPEQGPGEGEWGGGVIALPEQGPGMPGEWGLSSASATREDKVSFSPTQS